MRIYEGRGRGGPLDGKDLAHDKRMYRINVPVFPKPLATWHPPDEKLPPSLPEFNVELHAYVHVLGQWIWQRN